MTPLAAFLRGINVGRHNRIRMDALRALFEELGYAGARTHGQSGNVVFTTAPGADPAGAERTISEGIRAGLGLDVAVAVRTGAELAALVAANPLADVATDPARHLVVFLPATVDEAALAVAAGDWDPERTVIRGRDAHVWCPGGVRNSPLLSAVTGPKVAPGATVRNWRTVVGVLALLGACHDDRDHCSTV